MEIIFSVILAVVISFGISVGGQFLSSKASGMKSRGGIEYAQRPHSRSIMVKPTDLYDEKTSEKRAAAREKAIKVARAKSTAHKKS